MLRRFSLVAVSCLGLAGVFANAAMAEDPIAKDCVGKIGVSDITLSVKPDTAGSVSAFAGNARLCGSDVLKAQGATAAQAKAYDVKGFTDGVVRFPHAIKSKEKTSVIQTRCSNPKWYKTSAADNGKDPNGNPKKECPAGAGEKYSLDVGQYVGSSGVSVVGVNKTGKEFGNGGPLANVLPLIDVKSDVYVDKAPTSTVDNKDHCTKDAIACYQGVEPLTNSGVSDMIIRKTPGKPTNELVIYPIAANADFTQGLSFYYLEIGTAKQPIDLCQYAGAVNAIPKNGQPKPCGDATSGDWIQKNTVASYNSCDIWEWFALNVGGNATKTWKGYGFIVDVTTNVPGAKEFWMTKWLDEVAKYQKANPKGNWTLQKGLVDLMNEGRIVGQDGKPHYPHKFCAPLTIKDSGAGKPGSKRDGRR